MAWPRGVREAGLALVVAAGVSVGLGWQPIGPLRILETASLDLRFRLRGPEPPGSEVAVVLVDDKTLTALGRWPLSRHLFAKAVDAITGAGAKLIVFDMLFAEPDRAAPADWQDAARAAAQRLAGPDDAALRERMERLAADDPDADLAAAIKRSGRVLLPIALSFSGEAEANPPDYLSDQGYQAFDKSPETPVYPLQAQAAVTPVPVLAEAAAGFGHVNIPYDLDGEPRYDYLAVPFNGDLMPSMPVRAAAAYLGVPWDDVAIALGAGVRIGALSVPTDGAMRLVVNYRGPRGTIPIYSFVDAVDGKIPADKLAGRIVLLGASFIGIADSNPAPFNNTPVSGTERMATIIDTILHRDFIRESPPPWRQITLAAVLALALAGGATIALTPTLATAPAAAAPLVAWVGGVQFAFVRGLWLPLVEPSIALAAAMLSVLLFRYGFVDRERRLVSSAFRHYLAPEMVDELAAHPEGLHLGGETRALTLMFSDIRGFTSISEAFKSNPQGLSRLINQGFLTPMTRLIMARRGTVDKYMGDCIMAFWNAPLDDAQHADHACDAALAMIAELDVVNATLKSEALAEGRAFQPIQIGVGINTGECVVGNMGSDERFAYTAMGDAVNLASRLEGQSKTYHLAIVVGEDTRAAAPDWAALELDLVEVKGKHEAVRIYTLLGDADLARTPRFMGHAASHQRMLDRYRAQDWAGAAAALAECRGFDPRLDGLYDLYAERIAGFIAHPPGPEWAGVFVAETK